MCIFLQQWRSDRKLFADPLDLVALHDMATAECHDVLEEENLVPIETETDIFVIDFLDDGFDGLLFLLGGRARDDCGISSSGEILIEATLYFFEDDGATMVELEIVGMDTFAIEEIKESKWSDRDGRYVWLSDERLILIGLDIGDTGSDDSGFIGWMLDVFSEDGEDIFAILDLIEEEECIIVEIYPILDLHIADKVIEIAEFLRYDIVIEGEVKSLSLFVAIVKKTLE